MSLLAIKGRIEGLGSCESLKVLTWAWVRARPSGLTGGKLPYDFAPVFGSKVFQRIRTSEIDQLLEVLKFKQPEPIF